MVGSAPGDKIKCKIPQEKPPSHRGRVLPLLWSDFRQASDAPHAKELYSYSLGSIFNVCDVLKSEKLDANVF